MKRALILDDKGNAVMTVNDDLNMITIHVGEFIYRGQIIPSKQFQISGIDVIKDIQGFLSSIIQTNKELMALTEEKRKLTTEVSNTPLGTPEHDTFRERLKQVNNKLNKIYKK